MPGPAQGHPTSQFYSYTYPSNSVRHYEIDDDVPSGAAFRARIRDGIATWSNGAGGQAPEFPHDGEIDAFNQLAPCDNSKSIVFTLENLASYVGRPDESVFGYTPPCVNSAGVMQRFQMTLETTADPPGAVGWYVGTGTPGPNQFDLESTVTHEAGHATGWLGHFSHVNLCPTPPVDAVFETMCGENAGTGTPMKRTREEHDLHTFNAAY